LYEYECPKDGRFELIRQFSDKPLKKCPKCGRPVEKLASAPAIQFKGTGWYVTDYAKKSGGAESKESKEGKSDSKSESKSEGKSAATKAEGKSKDSSSKDSSSKESSSTKESKDSTPSTTTKDSSAPKGSSPT
jgi:putative FmdB family regulatory protein